MLDLLQKNDRNGHFYVTKEVLDNWELMNALQKDMIILDASYNHIEDRMHYYAKSVHFDVTSLRMLVPQYEAKITKIYEERGIAKFCRILNPKPEGHPVKYEIEWVRV